MSSEKSPAGGRLNQRPRLPMARARSGSFSASPTQIVQQRLIAVDLASSRVTVPTSLGWRLLYRDRCEDPNHP